MRDSLDELYEEYSFYQEYLNYLQAVEKQEIQSELEKITREIVKTRIEQAIFAIVVQSVDDPNIAANYIASFKVFSAGRDNTVYFSPSTPVINYIETGVKPFSMKEKLLSSGSVKISKEGFPYKTVPLTRKLASPNAKMDTMQRVAARTAPIESVKTVLTSKEIEMQSRINSVLQKTKFSFLEDARDAQGRTIRRSIASESTDIGTLIKEETFESTLRQNKIVGTKYVIFRTISAKPGSSDWMHPGFSGKEIYAKILEWKDENEERIFSETLDSLLNQAFGES